MRRSIYKKKEKEVVVEIIQSLLAKIIISLHLIRQKLLIYWLNNKGIGIKIRFKGSWPLKNLREQKIIR